MRIARACRWRRCCGVCVSYVIAVFTIEQVLWIQHEPSDVINDHQLNSPSVRDVHENRTLTAPHDTHNSSSMDRTHNRSAIDKLVPPTITRGNISLTKPPVASPPAKPNIVRPKPRDPPARRKVDPRAEQLRIAHEAELEKTYYRPRPDKVNPYKYDFVATPRKLCDESTQMLVIVHSFHPFTDRRRAIRGTWGKVARGQPWPRKDIDPKAIKLAFILGQHKDPGLNDMILEEADRYNDIIVGSFMDSYNNMTLKSLLGLKFFVQHCHKAKVLVKSDDDMVVNLPHLLNITRHKNMTWGIMGPLNKGAKVYRSGKWKLSIEDYPFKYFPPYENGATYVISADLVPELFELSEYVPSIFIDDVYITGILGKILNITHVFQRGFPYWTDRAPSSCDINEDKIVSGTKMNPDKLYKMWQDIVDDVKKCPVHVPPPKRVQQRNKKT